MQWLTGVRRLSYTSLVPINYMQMLLDLMEERQKWIDKRDASIREISRLSELIRATMNMIPAEQIARYEPIFERIEERPAGLSMAIRACFTGGATPARLWAERSQGSAAEEAALAGDASRAASGKAEEGQSEEGKSERRTTGQDTKAWLSPVEIRDALKRMGFPFENYKANPLASIHTTLKRMVPAEMDVKTLDDGQKVYRLKSAGQWADAMAEVRHWLTSSFELHRTAGNVVAVKRLEQEHSEKKEATQDASQKDRQPEPPTEGKKRGTSGGA